MSRSVEAIRADIQSLATNERTSKALIIALAPEVVSRIHLHDDVDTANRFLLALSEANQKMVARFYAKFSGHRFGEGILGKRLPDFTNKDGKQQPFVKAVNAFNEFVESGMNIFQWAFATRDQEAKPIDLNKVGQQWQKKAKKAIEEGASKQSVLQAALGDLFSVDEVLNILGQLAQAEENKA